MLLLSETVEALVSARLLTSMHVESRQNPDETRFTGDETERTTSLFLLYRPTQPPTPLVPLTVTPSPQLRCSVSLTVAGKPAGLQ